MQIILMSHNNTVSLDAASLFQESFYLFLNFQPSKRSQLSTFVAILLTQICHKWTTINERSEVTEEKIQKWIESL